MTLSNAQEPKNMWSERRGDELYVFHNGEVIYKQHKPRPSILFNKSWPNEEIV